MRRFPSSSRPFPILLVGWLALSTCLLWGAPPIEKVPTQLLANSTSVAGVSEDQISQYLAQRLPLLIWGNPGRASSPKTSFNRYPNSYHLPLRNNVGLSLDTAAADFWSKQKYWMSIDSEERVGFVVSYSEVFPETPNPVNDWERYARQIPWAGSIIQRVCREAKAHPRITRVVTMLRPEI